MYFKDIDKTITTFVGSEKSDPNHVPLKEALEYRNKHMITKTIMALTPITSLQSASTTVFSAFISAPLDKRESGIRTDFPGPGFSFVISGVWR